MDKEKALDDIAITIKKSTIWILRTLGNTVLFVFIVMILLEAFKVSVWLLIGILFITIVTGIIFWAFDRAYWLE